MESSSYGAFLRAAPRSMPWRLFSIATSLAFMLHQSVTAPCRSQEPNTGSSRSPTIADNRFYTPQATAANWVQAVNKHNWREEYNCYAGMQQAKFTYQVMVSTRELSDAQDLSIELSRILQRYRFPASLLDKFPSQRMDLSDLSDLDEIESAIHDQHQNRQVQLMRWESEVQPLNIDWASLIGELQPLLVQSYQRHEYDAHPSHTGIAHHLHYHRFDRPSRIKVVGNRAEGSIIAVVCDPEIVVDDGAVAREPKGFSAIFTLFDRSIQKLPIRKRRLKRPPATISLLREAEGWKIDSVPFR